MKIAAVLVLMMALGLSAAYSVDLSNDAVEVPSPEDFMDQLLNGDDDDDEIVDMDDALNKYRMLKEISRILAQAEASELMNPKKRFIGAFFDKVKEAIKKAAKKVTDFFTAAWNKAKEAAKKIDEKLDFSGAVAKLIPRIHSGETVAACEKTLETAAGVILGPAAPFATKLALPLCDAALAKIEDFAG